MIKQHIQNIKKFDQTHLREHANVWLNDCLNSLKTSLSKTFKYANNLKSLVIIRDAVVEFESSIQNDSTLIKNQQFNWSIVCEKLFDSKIQLWSQLVAPFYYVQAKVLISFKWYTLILIILIILIYFH